MSKQQIISRKAGAKRKWKGTSPGKQNVRPMSGDEMAQCQPHRRGLPDHLKLAPEAETPFGRMFLNGELNDRYDETTGWKRHEAGQRYRTVVLAYLSSIGSPRDTMPGGKGYRCLSDPPHCDHECECLRRKHAYNEAFECMSGDHKAQTEVAHVVVHGKPCRNMDNMLRGLDRLVRQLLTNRRNSVLG